MDDSKIIITIVGADKVGIVATITNIMAKYQVNIEDIRQTIMRGCFNMMMLVDFSNATCSFQEFKDNLSGEADKIGMEIWIQRKEIFDKMHFI